MANQFDNGFLTIIATLLFVGTIIISGAFGSSHLTNTGDLWATDSDAQISEGYTTDGGIDIGGCVLTTGIYGTPEYEYLTPVYIPTTAPDIDYFSAILGDDISGNSQLDFYFSISDLGQFYGDFCEYVFVADSTSGYPTQYYDFNLYFWAIDSSKKAFNHLLFYDDHISSGIDGSFSLDLSDNIVSKNYAESFEDFGIRCRINLVGDYGSGDIFGFGLVYNGTADVLYPSQASWNFILAGMGIVLIALAVVMTDYIDLPIGKSGRGR